MDNSLAKLGQSYFHRLCVLKDARLMSKAAFDNDSSYKENFIKMTKTVDEVKVELANTDKRVPREQQHLKSLENLRSESSALLEYLQYVLDNVPGKISQRKPDEAPTGKDEVQNSKSTKSSVVQAQNIGCQHLDFLTVDEFQCIPKYMKGRLTYDKINSVVEKLDKVYVEKYKIRRLKKSSLNDVNKKRYEAYRLQETEETKGVHFIVEQDITDFSSLKMDNVMRNILTILRHCGLIFEVRGGGYTRFGCHSRY